MRDWHSCGILLSCGTGEWAAAKSDRIRRIFPDISLSVDRTSTYCYWKWLFQAIDSVFSTASNRW
jgi:hypothetical protein